MLKPTYKKILVIRFSSIGDIVLTSPVVRCLKKQIEGENEIHFITKKPYESLLTANPYIDKIYTIEKNINEVLNQLIDEKYSCIIDLHNNLRSIILRGKLGCLAYTYNKDNFKKWVLVNFKINKLPKLHIVERYFEAVRFLHVFNDNKGLDYFVPENQRVDFDLIPQPFKENYIVFAIGGTYFTKRLPVVKIIEICKKINHPIYILGGKEDIAVAEEIKKALGKKVYNGCGLFTINQAASVIERAAKVITHDTGMMHIAAAFKKEIISIWGNTVPEFGMYPYFPKNQDSSVMVQVENLSCRPCSKLGYNTCPKKHFKCMENISTDEIVQVVNS